MAALTAGHWALLAFASFVFFVCFLAVLIALARWLLRRKAVSSVATKLEPYVEASTFRARHPGRAWADYVEERAKDQFAEDLSQTLASAYSRRFFADHQTAIAPPSIPLPAPKGPAPSDASPGG